METTTMGDLEDAAGTYSDAPRWAFCFTRRYALKPRKIPRDRACI